MSNTNATTEEQTVSIPIFPTTGGIVVFPGTYLPINVHESWLMAMIESCMNLSTGEAKVFGVLPIPSNTGTLSVIGPNAPEWDNDVGTIVRIVNIQTGNAVNLGNKTVTQGFKCVVTVKGTQRFRVLERSLPTGDRPYPTAVIESYNDIKDTGPSTSDEISSLRLEAHKLIRNFTKEFATNSMWRSILPRVGNPPYGESAYKLSLWLSAALVKSAPGAAAEDRSPLESLRLTSTLERLRWAVASWKRAPPVVRVPQKLSASSTLEQDDFETALEKKGSLQSVCLNATVKLLDDREDEKMIEKIVQGLREISSDVLERILFQLGKKQKLSNQLLQSLSDSVSLQGVESLCLCNSRHLKDSDLTEVSRLSWLLILDLSGSYNITDHGLSVILQSNTSLEQLNIAGCKHITDESLQYIVNLRDLQKLDISTTKATTRSFIFISRLPELIELSVNSVRQFADDGLKALIEGEGSLPSRLLSLSASHSKIRDYPELLGKFQELTTLEFGFNPQIKRWEFLSQLTNLTKLDVSMSNSIDDDAVQYLSPLTSLTDLKLSRTDITDVSINGLSSLVNLKSLDLSSVNMTETQFLSGLTNLTTLHASYTHVSDNLLQHLTGSHHIQSFKATASIEFGNTAVLQLCQSPAFVHLTSLDVGHDLLTDAGLANIKMLTALQSLKIWCSHCTMDVVRKLREECGFVMDTTMNTVLGTYILTRDVENVKV